MEALKKGSKGDSVKALQKALNLYPDGIFGPNTEETVKKFQSDNGLTADGIVGDKTWSLIKGKSTPSVSYEDSGFKRTSRPIKDIILHCTATPEGKDYTVDTIRKWHKERGWSDIGYHYVIYRDGSIHTGRDINLIGSHCEGRNTGSIGIVYVGGLTSDAKKAKDTRTPEQKKSLVKLVKKLLDMYNLTLSNVHCHNNYSSKACPSFSRESFLEELKA